MMMMMMMMHVICLCGTKRTSCTAR